MPFFTLYHPCIGLGLLKAALSRYSIPCDVWYLNIDCAAWIGFADYNRICHAFSQEYNALIGEWVFTRALFGERAPDPELYVQEILRKRRGRYLPPDFVQRLIELRDLMAHEFLPHCLSAVDWAQYFLVGFSSSFQQTIGSLALARQLKKIFPETLVVFGGANCEGEMGLTLLRSFPFLDAVFSGEADHSFPSFVRAVCSGGPVGRLNGVFHRLNRRVSVPDSPTDPVLHLDELPYPDFDDYFDQIHSSQLWPSVRGPNSPQVAVETSRGCWWGAKRHCTFCGLNGSSMAYRSKSPERALEEFLYLQQRYDCFIQVVDNILDLRYIQSLFPQMARQQVRLRLFYETKVNLSKEQLRVLKEAGVVALQPGIESLSTDVLQLMRKGCDVLQNIQFLKWCKELGIEAGWNLIWGFPGEDPADYCRMMTLIDGIQHLSPPMAINKLQLHRFSPYFVGREAMGVTNVRPHPSYFHIFPLPEETIAGLAYYFTFDYADGRRPREYAAPLIRRLQQWQQTEGSFHLVGFDDGEVLTIHRLNRGEPEELFRLRGLDRDLYLFCDQARALSSIVRFASERDGGRADSGEALARLERLVALSLMFEDNRNYLSLAVLSPQARRQRPLGLELIGLARDVAAAASPEAGRSWGPGTTVHIAEGV